MLIVWFIGFSVNFDQKMTEIVEENWVNLNYEKILNLKENQPKIFIIIHLTNLINLANVLDNNSIDSFNNGDSI